MFLNHSLISKKGILKCITLFCFFVNFILVSFCQVSVTLPVERSVFQRVNNLASIPVGGNVQNFADQIQARLTSIQGGKSTDWVMIANSPKGGAFSGQINNVVGGWYKLEVRSIENGIQIGEIVSVQKVGVGEVFIVAGQSNAQGGRPPSGGFFDKTYFGASDDRVNCIDFYDDFEDSLLPFPKIARIGAETNIAPHGGASWCYGLLGDKIARELNVPVLFFNAGVGGTRVKQWAEAARDERVYDFYKNRFAPNGWPYAYLKKSINYYASLFGVRAVLWHQGEEESLYGVALNDYKKDLSTVISKSREHFGKNISWMVAKVSRQAEGTNQTVKDAQQMVIDSSGFNVFQGPDTDGIQPASEQRDGGVHIHGKGLIQLAEAWANSIVNERFLLTSTPQPASPLLQISTSNCINKSNLTVSFPDNYTNPLWIWDNGQSLQHTYNKTINSNSEHYALAFDSNKNYNISAPFVFSPTTLEIHLTQEPKICFGQSLLVSAISSNNNFIWNTGEKTKQISISKSGDYNLSVTSNDIYGCALKSESSFNLALFPLPVPPIIEAASSTSFCDGGNVTIAVKSNGLNNRIWSNGEVSSSISVTRSGKIFLQNIDSNNCKSNSSNIIEVLVNPLPEIPAIQYDGKKQFCDGDSLKLFVDKATGYFWENNSQPINGYNKREIFVKNSGDYTAKVKNSFGCISNISTPVIIKKLNLPDAPVIKLTGKAAICAGDTTEIRTEYTAKDYTWYSNGGNIEANIQPNFRILSTKEMPNTEKFYKLKVTDYNGCISDYSNEVKVVIKARPDPPIIEKIGPYTLLANGVEGVSVSYIWTNNQISIDNSNLNIIKATKSGTYAAKATSNYLINNSSLNCTSDFSKGFSVDFMTTDFFVVYPNPTHSGKLYIETVEDFINTQLVIYSILGEKLLIQTLNNTASRQSIDVHHLKGYFILELQSGSKVVRKNVFID